MADLALDAVPLDSPRVLVVNCFPDPLRDHRRVLREVERHGPVETLRPRDHHPHRTSREIRGNPRFVGLGQAPAGRGHGPLDPRAPGSWDTFPVEYGQRHLKTGVVATRCGWPSTAHCSGRRQRQRALPGTEGPPAW
jgi:hypothetical protein